MPNNYSYGKTFVKGLWILGEVVLAGIAASYGNSTYYLAVAPILEMLRNYIKHRKD